MPQKAGIKETGKLDPGMLPADGLRMSLSWGTTLHWEELPHPRVHPLLRAVCIQWLADRRTQRLISVPQFGTSLKGHPRLRAPVVVAGVSNANYVISQFNAILSQSFVPQSLTGVVPKVLSSEPPINKCLSQHLSSNYDSSLQLPW